MNRLCPPRSLKPIWVAALVTMCALGSIRGTFAAQDEFRTWSDASGKFKIEAKLLEVVDEKAVLERKDGKQVRIPLNKLSKTDQEFLAESTGDSPFEMVEDSDSGEEAGESSDSEKVDKPKTVKVDYTKVRATAALAGDWNVKIEAAPETPVPTEPIDLPGSKIEREGITRVATNVTAKRLAVSYSPNDPWKKENNNTTRLLLMDLESGTPIGNAIGPGRWEIMAIHDDGETLVVRNETEGAPKGQLGTVKVSGKKLTPVDIWTPYDALEQEDKEKVVTFAEFANDGKLVTCSQWGNVVIWDFATKKPLARFDYHGACSPSLSPDRKVVGFSGGDIVGFFDIATKKMMGVKEAPQMNYWLKSAFSPSGKRFAAATLGKVMVWEVESGEVLFEGGFPGISPAQGLQFPHEDYLLLSNDFLIEFSSKIKLWQYMGTNYMSKLGTLPMFGVNHDGGLRFMPTKLPHAEATRMLTAAKQQSDLFILKKGVNISIDTSGIPPQYQQEVEAGLKQQIERLGCKLTSSAPLVLKASVSGPKQEAVEYFFAGAFVFQQYSSVLEIMYNGNQVWVSSATNQPGSINRGSREEMQQQLNEAGSKPYLGFFGNTVLPEFLQKPSGSPQGGGQAKQTIGLSRVTATGFQTVK